MATLSDLRTRARSKSDTTDSNRPSNSEFNTWINDGIANLHDILVKQNPDRYTEAGSEFTTTAGTLEYALPATFYKLRGVERKLSTNNWERVRKFNWNERNDAGIRYRQRGLYLRFTDVDGATYRVWHIPAPTALSDDADTYDAPNRYEQYVAAYAARQALMQEESDTVEINNELMALEQRILASAGDVDTEEPDTISDVYSYNPHDWEMWDEY